VAAVASARVRHDVPLYGHTFAVFERSVANPRGTIVLVHGRTWSALPDFDLRVPSERRSLMEAFVAQGYSAWAVDLRGYGGTPRDASGWLSPSRAADDLVGLVHWIAARTPGAPAPALLGWSRGALVAQLAVQRDPTVTSALILYGTPADPDREPVAARPSPDAPPREPTTPQAAASDFITPGAVTKATVEAYVAACLAADPVKVDWRDEHEWNELDPARVQVPTLLLHGEHDPYAPVAAQARLFARLGHPDRSWIVLGGADHAAHLESAGPRFVAAVVGFLAAIQSPP
jgi:pimeloyl-ACP methyl ester carboxylesterase